MAIVTRSRQARLRSYPLALHRKRAGFPGRFTGDALPRPRRQPEKDAYLTGRDHIGIIPLYMGCHMTNWQLLRSVRNESADPGLPHH